MNFQTNTMDVVREIVKAGFEFAALNESLTEGFGINHPDEAPKGLVPWRVFPKGDSFIATRCARDLKGEWII